MSDNKQNIYIVTLYSFIPLSGRPRGKYKEMINSATIVPPHRLIKYTEAKYRVTELKEDNCDFFYEYCCKEVEYRRKIHLRAWLYEFSSVVNPHGQYYLATTISIDKAFEGEDPHFPFGLSNICTARDIVQLKKAHYGGDDHGLYYFDCCKRKNIHNYLDGLIERITGRNPKGRYGRHYIVDVCGVDVGNGQRIESRDHLSELFSRKYYGRERTPYEDVIEQHREFVYGLLYGNDNNEVIPDGALNDALKDSFSSNITERLFAGHKTVVFLHTHHPFPFKESNENKRKYVCQNVESDSIIYDAFLVMEARLKLKSIERSLNTGHPKNIKDALASISRYLSVNPYHLGEYENRYKMLYQNMGINNLLKSVKEQGDLLSDAKEIDYNEKINCKVYLLTILTVIIGGLSLIVSILCCNNSNNSSRMCNCYSESISSQFCCVAVLGVLLGLLLAACIVVTCIYQVKCYYKLKDIENQLKEI